MTDDLFPPEKHVFDAGAHGDLSSDVAAGCSTSELAAFHAREHGIREGISRPVTGRAESYGLGPAIIDDQPEDARIHAHVVRVLEARDEGLLNGIDCREKAREAMLSFGLDVLGAGSTQVVAE